MKSVKIFLGVLLTLAVSLALLQPTQHVAADPPLLTCGSEQVRSSQRWWYFGNRAVMDFGVSGTTVTAQQNPVAAVNTREGSTVVTDTAGQLQFWVGSQSDASSSVAIFDRNQNIMQNGSGIVGNNSAVQMAASLPVMGEPGKYIVVLTSASAGGAGQLYYSLIDMNQNGGLGAVDSTIKNVPLGAASTSSEALTAVPDDSGTGYWVISNNGYSPDMYAHHFVGGTYAGTVHSVMSNDNYGGWTTIYANQNNLSQLIQVTTGVSTSKSDRARLMDFNATTGVITEVFNWQPFDAPGGSGAYSADFSPNGEYVYIAYNGGGYVYRYKIAGATTGAEVAASGESVGNTGAGAGGHIRLAPDGKMYVTREGATALSVIADPDNPDVASVGFSAAGFPLAAGSTSRYGLPQMVVGCNQGTSSFGDGIVFNDTNNNGVYEAGTDAPIANVPIVLDGCSAGPDGVINTTSLPMTGAITCSGDDELVHLTTTTDANGEYGFDRLYNGRYRLTETQPAGYTDGQRVIGSAGGTANAVGTTPSVITDIVVGLGVQATGYNFAEIRHAVSITKTSNPTGVLTPSGTVQYTIIATNEGTVVVPSVVLADDLSDAIASASWTCTAGGGAVCPASSGTGSLNETITDLPVGGSLTYVIQADLEDELPAMVENVATLTGDALFCMPQNTPGPCLAVATNPPAPILEVVKTVNATNASRGDSLTWTIVVRSANANSGANGTVITDTMPSGVTNVSWECVATNGAVCPAASGNGSIQQTIATFPASGVITYTVQATVADSAHDTLANTASAAVADGLCLPDFTAAPCTATATTSVPPLPPTPPAPHDSGGDNSGLASTGQNIGMWVGVSLGIIAVAIGATYIVRWRAHHI